jgi:NAD(P)-dependent dehydrogenase (short-subunit alcohol dehydrogenase family)
MSNLFDISGKAAIVTGAASGLGLSIAEAMAEHGARIALFDLNQKGLEEAEHRTHDVRSGSKLRDTRLNKPCPSHPR